jgi:CheY-like chemotaxis protein
MTRTTIPSIPMALIYVIDDSPGTRHFIAAALGKGPHEVRQIEPTCLVKVLELLHQAPPDLLVTDLVMPDCPGQTLIRVCREDPHLQQVRILLLTAHGDPQLAHFLQKMGNVHYLAKPIAPAMLADCAESLLSPGPEMDPGWSLACNGVVAVVDDSHLSRAYHAACLRKGGFRPVQIEPGGLLETVMSVEEAQPDLLVVDYLMTEFNGDALLRAIRGREALRDLPALVVTAHRADEIQSLLIPIGGVDVLYKPVPPEDLVERVRMKIR